MFANIIKNYKMSLSGLEFNKKYGNINDPFCIVVDDQFCYRNGTIQLMPEFNSLDNLISFTNFSNIYKCIDIGNKFAFVDIPESAKIIVLCGEENHSRFFANEIEIKEIKKDFLSKFGIIQSVTELNPIYCLDFLHEQYVQAIKFNVYYIQHVPKNCGRILDLWKLALDLSTSGDILEGMPENILDQFSELFDAIAQKHLRWFEHIPFDLIESCPFIESLIKLKIANKSDF